MDGPSVFWMVQGLVMAVAALALLYALWLQRGQSQGARVAAEAARETARLSLQAAELHAQALKEARATVEAAARVQRLAARPVLKVGLTMPGLLAEVGRSPVLFALHVRNVGHGTAVLEEVRVLVRGEPALTYGRDTAELASRIGTEVFQRAVGASVQALSGKLTVTPLTDEARALEASGSLDLFRVQVFAHNAEAVEQGLETVSAEVRYRDLDGAKYSSVAQFRVLTASV